MTQRIYRNSYEDNGLTPGTVIEFLEGSAPIYPIGETRVLCIDSSNTISDGEFNGWAAVYTVVEPKGFRNFMRKNNL